MAKIRLSKNGTIAISLLLFALFAGVVGYFSYTLYQAQNLGTTDSSAGGCNYGSKSVCENRSEGRCKWDIPDDALPGEGARCIPNPDWTSPGGDGGCTAAQCASSLDCKYPRASMCTKGGRCVCLTPEEQYADNPIEGAYCAEIDNKCNPPGCAEGEIDCGTSVEHENDPSCVEQGGKRCQASCSSCGNTSYIYRYCKPKPADNNSCGDGANPAGTITAPVPNKVYNPGQTVTITGTATDKDGLGKITIKLDNQDITSQSNCGATGAISNNVTPWRCTYTLPTTITEGTKSFAISWVDGKGIAGPACQLALAFKVEKPKTSESWDLKKTSRVQCYDQNTDNPYARVDYTITVKYINTNATAKSNITKVEDEPASNAKYSWLISGSVNPASRAILHMQDVDRFSGNIVWDGSVDGNNPPGYEFTAGQSRTFSYSFKIPYGDFGTFVNKAKIFNSTSTNAIAEVTNQTYVTCTPQPQTGLFDSTASRIVLALVLLLASIVYIASDKYDFGATYLYREGRAVIYQKDKQEKENSKFEKKFDK